MPPVLAAAIPAIVAGTVGVITGTVSLVAAIGAALLAAAVGGLQMLLRPKPTRPSVSARRDQLTLSALNSVAPREIVFGKIRKGGTILFRESVNNQTELLMIVELAGHEVTGIDEVYFFEDLVIAQSGQVQGKYFGFVEYEKHLGSPTQTVSQLIKNASTNWTDSHRLQGIAYIALKLKFDRDVFNSMPNVSAVIRGAKVYDPRDGLTKFTSNAALCLAHYLNHPLYGLNVVYDSEIATDILIASANACEEDVAIKPGKMLQFNQNEGVVIGDVLNEFLTGAFTIEVRIYPYTLSAVQRHILNKWDGVNGFSLFLEGDKVNFTTMGLSDTVLVSASSISAQAWSHITAVRDPANGKKQIWINGVLDAEDPATGTVSISTELLRIGWGFSGIIQDVRLWKDVRIDTEIMAFVDKTLTGRETDLLAYWKLNEKRGTVAEDATETSNDGSIVGATWVDVDPGVVLGSEERYSTDGVVYSDQLPREIIEDMLSAMAGSAVFSGGLWNIQAGVSQMSTVHLTDTDARDAIRVQGYRSKKDLFNSVRGTFISPENLYQSADFPLITFPAFEVEDGGERLTLDIELPFTISSSAAQRLGWLHLLLNRQQITVGYKAKLSALRLRAGTFVGLTHDRFGWDDKDFEVTNWQFVQVDDEAGIPALGIDLELHEIAGSIFDFNPATDEIPLDPAPNTLLPNPFGTMPLYSYFFSRSGFQNIASPPQTGIWPGIISGFVRNPLTGHLNVDDQILANGGSAGPGLFDVEQFDPALFDTTEDSGFAVDDFAVFDQYVQQPVPVAYYESPEIDIEFDDVIRTFIEGKVFKGAGEAGAFQVARKYKVKKEHVTEQLVQVMGGGGAITQQLEDSIAGVYGDWIELIGTAKAEGRWFKHRMEFDFSSGYGGYLGEYLAVVDKATFFTRAENQIVPIGGKTFAFPSRYHNIPNMKGSAHDSSAKIISFMTVTKFGVQIVVFDINGTDTGGVIDYEAAGV